MKKKIYIAGKITGLKDYKKNFDRAEVELKKQGHVVVNPSVVPEGLNYDDYMNICTAMLKACDTIYMLNNWKDSTGAKIEHQIAELSGKEIIYQWTDNKPKLISTWEELKKETSPTHTLEIDSEYGCGWINPKESNEEYWDGRYYLSTHTFYGSQYEYSTMILQKCGFNVEIANWDEGLKEV